MGRALTAARENPLAAAARGPPARLRRGRQPIRPSLEKKIQSGDRSERRRCCRILPPPQLRLRRGLRRAVGFRGRDPAPATGRAGGWGREEAVEEGLHLRLRARPGGDGSQEPRHLRRRAPRDVSRSPRRAPTARERHAPGRGRRRRRGCGPRRSAPPSPSAPMAPHRAPHSASPTRLQMQTGLAGGRAHRAADDNGAVSRDKRAQAGGAAEDAAGADYGDGHHRHAGLHGQQQTPLHPRPQHTLQRPGGRGRLEG